MRDLAFTLYLGQMQANGAHVRRPLEWFKVTLLQELDRVAREEAEFERQAFLDENDRAYQLKLQRDERSRRFDHLDADQMGGGGGNFDGAGTGGQD